MEKKIVVCWLLLFSINASASMLPSSTLLGEHHPFDAERPEEFLALDQAVTLGDVGAFDRAWDGVSRVRCQNGFKFVRWTIKSLQKAADCGHTNLAVRLVQKTAAHVAHQSRAVDELNKALCQLDFADNVFWEQLESTFYKPASDELLDLLGTGFGIVTQCNLFVDKLVQRGFEYHIDLRGDTRLKKLGATIAGGAQAGAEAGAALGKLTLYYPERLIGHGKSRQPYNIYSEGAVGVVLHAGIDIVSRGSGYATGRIGRALGSCCGSSKYGARNGYETGRDLVGSLLSIPAGGVLGAARVAAVSLKTLAVAGGTLLGTAAGTLGGVVRFVVDR